MGVHHLTQDEEYWIGVALENCLESAKVLAQSDDIGDQLDAGLLIGRYTELAKRFPSPEIGGRDD
jgi:hypothetical protein